ncbi:hypothetical protein SAMN05216262_11036 [Colwellia chukchiensis]|uniref:Uncharacterized protein n=1 Tax=Colwellia chukchiensis TaxID=641665 RepID=A0A1H7PUG3_9GAMM|nr:hypothetical protein [Colwellia chukchiensis]SEL39024.1 hypothetical protein SAMN05216262_11036 [Colwellia chukchiensis]
MTTLVSSIQNTPLLRGVITALVIILAIIFALGDVQAAQSQDLEMEQWLKARFSEQHQALIPLVAVADMLYSCEKERNVGEQLSVKSMLTQLDKNTLAEKLMLCLAQTSLQSDIALNFGLKACFEEQLAELAADERQQKMALVAQAITELSRAERQKSFTKCVTAQAIDYLR